MVSHIDPSAFTVKNNPLEATVPQSTVSYFLHAASLTSLTYQRVVKLLESIH